MALSATVFGTASRLMSEKKPKRPTKEGEPAERVGKISLYGLSIEDALRAAAKTGRPPPLEFSEAEAATEKTDETDPN